MRLAEIGKQAVKNYSMGQASRAGVHRSSQPANWPIFGARLRPVAAQARFVATLSGQIRIPRRALLAASQSKTVLFQGRYQGRGRVLLSDKSGGARWFQRLDALFQDHELFVRTRGEVRFLRITARWQKRVAGAVGAVLLCWGGITAAMAVDHMLSAGERSAVARQQAEAKAAEARIARYKDRIAETVADLEDRQARLEQMRDEHFGEVPADAAPTLNAAAAADANTETDAAAAAAPQPLSLNGKLPPEAAVLARLQARQDDFARRMLTAVRARTARAEVAVTRLGMNPQALVRDAASARGGPFEPWRGRSGRSGDFGPVFAALDKALFRMEVLERTLVAVPSATPAQVLAMSSSFGYRRDPLTGAAAMHSGIDFKGPVGTPILAAAPGRVVVVERQSGYGKVIDIDHGQGFLTRYAHLSAFDVQPGQMVETGQQIGRMGSTGRSTGSHLHFEVRVNGQAVDPRRFLEVRSDVRQVKAIAAQRVDAVERSQ